jgi:RND family efflux transporter MFP subunit
MTTIQFLTGWAIRSSILILSGALLLRVLRVKDPAVRLAAWTAVLCGSLAIPALTAALPKVPLAIAPMVSGRWEAPVADSVAAPLEAMPRAQAGLESHRAGVTQGFDWGRTAVTAYVLVALALLLRLCVGLAIALRLLCRSRSTGRATDRIEIRESEHLTVPVTIGIARPAIVLPVDWRQWDAAKLDAVLAHERSHVRRRDPAVQVLSALHRALLWHSPLSWFLHTRIVRVAEEASDDAAVAATRDRAYYAAVLLEFARGPQGASEGARRRRASWLSASAGVPMARYGRPDQRIDRILDETATSRGVTRWSLAAILVLGSPLAYLAAAAGPRSAPPTPPAAQPAPAQTLTPKPPAPAVPTVKPSAVASAQPERAQDYVTGLGSVTPFYTVTVKSRVDGELLAVSFKEGELVQKGQLLATIDPRPYQAQLQQAEGRLAEDQAKLNKARAEMDRYRNLVTQGVIPRPQFDSQAGEVAQLEARLSTSRANVENAKLQVQYSRIVAPITGVVGLRLIDPGNIVHASDSTGILVITQLQPIAVVFTIPENDLPRVRARLSDGVSLPVDTWSRDDTVRIATGRLTAIDNQIDPAVGTAKLKAVFNNQDGALFPNQFVLTHLALSPR